MKKYKKKKNYRKLYQFGGLNINTIDDANVEYNRIIQIRDINLQLNSLGDLSSKILDKITQLSQDGIDISGWGTINTKIQTRIQMLNEIILKHTQKILDNVNSIITAYKYDQNDNVNDYIEKNMSNADEDTKNKARQRIIELKLKRAEKMAIKEQKNIERQQRSLASAAARTVKKQQRMATALSRKKERMSATAARKEATAARRDVSRLKRAERKFQRLRDKMNKNTSKNSAAIKRAEDLLEQARKDVEQIQHSIRSGGKYVRRKSILYKKITRKKYYI